MNTAIDDRTEWLETDGLGGSASGTTSGVRTRRYHALLLAAAAPPAGRFVLVNAVHAAARTPAGEFPLTPHRFAPGVAARGADIESFARDPWPTWVYRLPDGTRIAHEVFVTRGSPQTVLSWRVTGENPGRPPVTLHVRPLLSGRDFHALHQENADFGFQPSFGEGWAQWAPYPGVPAVTVHHNGHYRHEPLWYRNFEYDLERERGFDSLEDLAAPGVFDYDLSSRAEAAMILSAQTPGEHAAPLGAPVEAPLASLRRAEMHRRGQFATALERSADAYIVRGCSGSTIIAGYPWFADWGRDTFISLRGLCLATGRLDDAREILLRWAALESEGMLPNRLPETGSSPEYNSVDASLWYIVACDGLRREAERRGSPVPEADLEVLDQTVQRILRGYSAGTRHGIRLDADGLLAAGEPGVQLTWMDARVGDHVVTPRIGKPVEVQALWLNALKIGSERDSRWSAIFARGLRSFGRKFWNPAESCLFDVVDDGHVGGAADASLRPNQILAVGGLPLCLLGARRARQVVDRVEAELLTPIGLRTLARSDPAYTPYYRGDPATRDGAYHQGTVWPWLLGPFVEAWLRVRGDSAAARRDARARFLEPLGHHVAADGLGHVCEIADGAFPHTPRGCPFQAWSLGELLRLERSVLAPVMSGPPAARAPRPAAVTAARIAV